MVRLGYWLVGCVLLYATYLLVLLTLPYLSFKPGIEFLETKQLVYHLPWYRYSFYFHIFSSVVLVFTGFLQFNRYILKNTPRFHRISGAIYLVVVLFLSGPSGWILSLYANGGILAKVSFLTLTSLWWITTLLAYYYLRKHEYLQHGNWMARSYSLTLSAVTLRFYAYLFDVFGVSFDPITTYTLLAYLSWIPNLTIAEWIIRKETMKRYL
jgi:hypothetical protein